MLYALGNQAKTNRVINKRANTLKTHDTWVEAVIPFNSLCERYYTVCFVYLAHIKKNEKEGKIDEEELENPPI